MKKVFIYVLKHPVTEEIRYVGLTRYPKKRLSNEIHRAHTRHLANWIKSITTLGLKPVMEVVEESEEGIACEIERKWISLYRGEGYRLINVTDGGESGWKYTEEYREKMSRIQKVVKRRPLSVEHKKKIGDALRGRTNPQAKKNVIFAIQSGFGRRMSDDAKKHLSDIQKKVMTGDRLAKLTEGNKRRIRPSKVTDLQKSEIKRLILDGYSNKVIAEAYGLTVGTISSVKRNQMWVRVEPSQFVSNPPVYKKIPLIRNQSGQYERQAA